MFLILAKYRNYWLKPEYLFVLALNRLILLIQKYGKINTLSLQFMSLTKNKSSGAILGNFVQGNNYLNKKSKISMIQWTLDLRKDLNLQIHLHKAYLQPFKNYLDGIKKQYFIWNHCWEHQKQC